MSLCISGSFVAQHVASLDQGSSGMLDLVAGRVAAASACGARYGYTATAMVLEEGLSIETPAADATLPKRVVAKLDRTVEQRAQR